MANSIKKLIIFVFSIFFLFLIYFLLTCYIDNAYGISPFCEESSEEKLFSIEKNQNLFQISKNLEEQGIIKNRFCSDAYILLSMNARKLQKGSYRLSSCMNISEIIEKIVSGETAKIKLIVPEGYTIEQIEGEINKIRKDNKITLFSFKAGDLKGQFLFLKDVPDENSLEGFLFPDTYYISEQEAGENKKELENIVSRMLSNFQKKFNPDLREKVERQNKSIFDVVIMASLIEKEVITLEDKKKVSGVLWKRLNQGVPLQVDSCLETYKKRGLPQKAICNPGLESIIASIYPEKTGYWYYLSTSKGETIFSKTLREHNINIIKYLKQ
ncbi:MAG: endolytic transglycosylase MltG [Patescibacteria group bacterium]|nr:endolytic transglycosylase MltG [Patescibacteria group bacterium]